MENSSNYMFQLPTTQDSLAQFRRKISQQPQTLENSQDINPQYLPPQPSMTRRKRRQKKHIINTTVIKVKPSQQNDQQQKKEITQPPILYEHMQQSIYSKKIQQSIDTAEKLSKDYNNMSTTQTKQLDNGQTVSYNSSSQQQNEYYQKQIQKIEKNSSESQKKSIFKAGSLSVLIKMKIPQKYSVKILIKLSKSLFSANVLDLYLHEDRKLLIRAIKSPIPFSGNFSIIDPNTKNQLGQVVKNFTGTEYILVCQDSEKRKKQMLWISYRLNIFGLAGQNSINMLRSNRNITKTDKFSDIKTYWQNGNRKKIQTFANRLAIKKNGNYQMDFHGMVTTPSSKNFIIDDENGVQCLLFGKRTGDIFAMNVSHPISILQAFALAISSIDGKLLVH